MSRLSHLAAALALAAAAIAAPSPARAGGIARPDGISARAVGMGGAYTAVADDGTAWFFNPAGAAWADDTVLIGGELVYAPRSYTPTPGSSAESAYGAGAQKATAAAPLPSLGVIIHPRSNGAPSRLAFGASLYDNFGGQISFPTLTNKGASAVNSTTDLVIEAAAGVAYEVDDVLAVGGAVRLGLGLFSVNTQAHPLDADISTVGVGVGATLGLMLRPTAALQVGLTWRSGMDVKTQGSGKVTLTQGGSPMTWDAQHTQHWPQQAALGAAVKATPDLTVSGEVDWTQWSSFENLLIEFPGNDGNNQNLDLNWRNNWSVRGGAEYRLPKGAVRAGAYYDTVAVPDSTIERQYLDSNKIGVAAGGAALFGDWRVDGALDFTLPGTRTVPDTKDFTVSTFRQPGDYSGFVVTLELAVSRRL